MDSKNAIKVLFLILSLLNWAVIPFQGTTFLNLNYGVYNPNNVIVSETFYETFNISSLVDWGNSFLL